MTEPATIESVRAQFPSAASSIHLDHASVGPISVPVAEAMQRVVETHLASGWQPGWRDEIGRVREQVAWLVGSRPQNIAFTQNTSFGISVAANGLAWRGGDNVVLPEREFPSNVYPWMNLAHLGVEVRKVVAPHGHAEIEDISAAIDDRTRMVAVSAVQFSNGHRYDLARIGASCRQHDVLFVVDGTQAVGALTVDVEDAGIDVLAVSCHKWMLGPPGIGFVHLSDRALDRLRPPVVGWLSVEDPFAFDYRLDLAPTAERFEPGTENVVGTIGLGGAIGLIERYGKAWVESRVLELSDHIRTRFTSHGFQVLGSTDPAARSGITIVTRNGASTEAMFQRLASAGVRCAVRSGGIRFSPHCYNTTDEIDSALELVG